MKRCSHWKDEVAVEYEAAIRDAFNRWIHLKAWGPRTFEHVKLVVRPDCGSLKFSGLVNRDGRQGRWKITIFVTDTSDTLSTLLHEMAHVARWNHGASHGLEWRLTYFAAVEEVTGRYPLPSCEKGLREPSVIDIDAAAESCLWEWLHDEEDDEMKDAA